LKLSVLGAGAWGTALAIQFSDYHDVSLWSRDPAQIALMRTTQVNARYLPDIELPKALRLTADLDAAVDGADLILLAAPTSAFRQLLEAIAEKVGDATVLWVCKGFEAGSMRLPHQIAQEILRDEVPCGVLSGPSFANEVARGLPTALTLASEQERARDMAGALHHQSLRVYTSSDCVGVEVGGALKNVMAIAAGISDGLGLGHNARAALISRGLAEMSRLGQALGGRAETFMGLTGMGDLILTATSDQSRNRQVGLRLARGEALNDILRDLGHVAEGVNSAREVVKLATGLGVDMPISQAVNQVLHQGLAPGAAVESLLSREPRTEQYR
jgi:glycerol-3-phosphate dehydrogenase (NAD(P)+)